LADTISKAQRQNKSLAKKITKENNKGNPKRFSTQSKEDAGGASSSKRENNVMKKMVHRFCLAM
jgi:hypothetical protein